MAQKRKLQIFVSSTYTDLKEERQAAVEAILTAGHIPAGMELFAGQNEEQMNIIKRWINESDIYMLLLGGRYGSIEEISGKSYTHLEFDYARNVGKTVFVVVANDKYIEQKVKEKTTEAIMELKHREEYLNFKKEITGKFVKHWESLPTLQLAIINTLHALEDDEALIGWVRGDEALNSNQLLEELSYLSKENKSLREKVIELQSLKDTSDSFLEIYNMLVAKKVDLNELPETIEKVLILIARYFKEKINYIYVFWFIASRLREGISTAGSIYWASAEQNSSELMPYVYFFEELGMVNRIFKTVNLSNKTKEITIFLLSDYGKEFLTKLRTRGVIGNIEEALKNSKMNS
ncbi:hypothetical protein GCM10028808_10280 [Spirosoma migulaei]